MLPANQLHTRMQMLQRTYLPLPARLFQKLIDAKVLEPGGNCVSPKAEGGVRKEDA
jgi:hypothetical protein